MSVILNRHGMTLHCTLGDGSLTAPNYPGQYERNGYVYQSSYSVLGYQDYPATTPDNICKIIRGGYYDTQLFVSSQGSTGNGTVTAGFPPSPISGSPFTYASIRGNRAQIYPRWSGETAWDLQTFADTTAFTPQGITSSDVFYPTGPFSSLANDSVSFDTGVMPNDISDGGDSSYDQEAEWEVLVLADKVCCFNEGTEIELNLVVWKIDFTPTAQAGSPGYFNITTGTSSYQSTITQTVTIDPSWQAGAFVSIHTFTIPKVVGHFTFVNDFYVSAITAP